MRKIVMGAVGAAVLSMVAGVVAGQAPPVPASSAPAVPLVVTQVKPGLYMLSGDGGNSTVRVGKDGLILVDTKNPGDAVHAELVKALQAISTLPVKDVIVTHHHADHNGGVKYFEADNIPVYGNEGLKAQLDAGGGRNAAHTFSPTYPDHLFAKTETVRIPGAEAKLYHFYPGHTGGDTIVYFPDIKVVSMGDELVAGSPVIDFAYGGSALGLQKSLAEVAKLDFDTAIPGHGGASMTRAQFDEFRKKWDIFIERARASIKAGTPKDKFLASIKTDDLGWNITTAGWSAPKPLDGFYAEMSK